jgi:hypothetical protein
MRKALVEMVGAAGVRELAIVAEEPIYEWHDVVVTTSRVTHCGRSYAIGDVSNVAVVRPRYRSMLALISAALSAALAAAALVFQTGQWILVAIAFAVVALVFRPATTRQVSINAGAERLTICCSNPAVAAEIADAIAVARRCAQSARRDPTSASDGSLAQAAGAGAA